MIRHFLNLLLPLGMALALQLPVQASEPPVRLSSAQASFRNAPALVRKPENVLLYLKAVVDAPVQGQVPATLSFSLSPSQGSLSALVESVQLYTGPSERVQDRKLICDLPLSDVAKGNTLTVPFQTSVQQGNNHFWVGVRLHDHASIAPTLSLQPKQLQLGGARASLKGNAHKVYLGTSICRPGDMGSKSFRIPGIVRTNKGNLIAVYDIRYNNSVDLQEKIKIGMNRSTDGGLTWTPTQVIMDMAKWGGRPEEENGIGDPAVLVDRTTGTIWVAAVWAHGHPGHRNWWASKPGLKPEQTSQFMLVKSEDEGRTWSEPINITEQVKHPDWYLLLQGPGMGITMRDGTLVFPAQFKDEKQVPHSTIIYSKDKGKTWKIGTGAKTHTTEAQVAELPDGSLMLNMRDDRNREVKEYNGRAVYVTRDLGATWQEHATSGKDLTESNCMASLFAHTYKGREVFFFSNPAVPKGRYNMTIKASLDQGTTWPAAYHLPYYPDDCFGYSCLVGIDDKYLGVLYEGESEIFFQRIPMADVLDK